MQEVSVILARLVAYQHLLAFESKAEALDVVVTEDEA